MPKKVNDRIERPKNYYRPKDVQEMCGVSYGVACKLIRETNQMILKSNPNAIIIQGRVSKKVFDARMFDCI